MKNFKFYKLFIVFICGLLLIPALVFADPPEDEAKKEAEAGGSDKYGLQETAQAAGMGEDARDLSAIVGDVVGAILAFVGVIFLVLMVVGGIMWMTAGGNEERVKKARSLIVNSIIGIVIIFSAYAIVYFVMNTLIAAT